MILIYLGRQYFSYALISKDKISQFSTKNLTEHKLYVKKKRIFYICAKLCNIPQIVYDIILIENRHKKKVPYFILQIANDKSVRINVF